MEPLRASEGTGGPGRACWAPEVQVFLRPDGQVRPCCINEGSLGDVAVDRLSRIWAGPARARLVRSLAERDFSLGCQACEAEIRVEGREGSYAADFDRWAGSLPPAGGSAEWPQVLNFNLSIDCNLQCVQCDGEQSSSIRLHREGRPPLANPYDDLFFEELPPFLRSARHAIFSGGEPFLGAANYRVWDLVAEVAPDLPCTVITNATQWNPRVRRVLERIPMSFVFSLDGITPDTYESIRVGADFARVMANVEEFLAYVRERGTTASVNHCLMVDNYHEFGDLLIYADQRGMHVDVSVVRKPSHVSIAHQSTELIAAIARHLESQSDSVLGRLSLNAATWSREVARIGTWARLSPGERARLWGVSGEEVLGLPRWGRGPHDDTEALRDLQRGGSLVAIHSFDVDRYGVIASCSTPLDERDGGTLRLEGLPADRLAEVVSEALGPMTGYRTVSSGPDRIDAEAAFGSTPARIALVAMRDPLGRADTGRILLALYAAGSSSHEGIDDEG